MDWTPIAATSTCAELLPGVILEVNFKTKFLVLYELIAKKSNDIRVSFDIFNTNNTE